MDLNLPSVELLETVSVFSRWLYSYKFSAVAEARFPPRGGWELAGIAKCSQICPLSSASSSSSQNSAPGKRNNYAYSLKIANFILNWDSPQF